MRVCVCVFQCIGLLQACIRCTVWAPYLAWRGNELLRRNELCLLGSSLVLYVRAHVCVFVCEPVCVCFCARQLKNDHSGAVVHSRNWVCWQHNWLAWHFNSPLLDCYGATPFSGLLAGAPANNPAETEAMATLVTIQLRQTVHWWRWKCSIFILQSFYI